MITRAELEQEALGLGFTLRQAEKDYIQHVVLHAIYATTTSEFIFKGGTALQKTYGLDRFSENLDFTSSVDAGTCMALLEKAIHILGDASITKTRISERSATGKIRVKGPLHDGRDISVQAVTVECSTRESISRDPRAVRVVPRYRDLRPYIALVMSEQEMLAEKIRALMTRYKARDLYDTWFLLQKGVSCGLDLVNSKLAFFRKEFAVDAFHDALHSKESSWMAEMKMLVRDVPTLSMVIPFVERGVLEMLVPSRGDI